MWDLGAAGPDFAVPAFGPAGLEVECKSISEDKGKQIHRADALRLTDAVTAAAKEIVPTLRGGVSITVTAPRRLPDKHAERQALAGAIARATLLGPGEHLLPFACSARVADFDIEMLRGIERNLDQAANRARLDAITGTRNRPVAVVGVSGGGALAVAFQSKRDDDHVESAFADLRKSARTQLSGNRAGLFIMCFRGLSGAQLIQVAEEDASGRPRSRLSAAAERFFSSKSRDHVIGVVALGRDALDPRVDDAGSGSGAYYFNNRKSPRWDAAFEGMVTAVSRTAG